MKKLLCINGQIIPESSKTHIVHNFNVESCGGKLIFMFSYEPKKLNDERLAEKLIKEGISKYVGSEKQEALMKWKSFLPLQNLITISIDDPFRFRGAAHRHSPDQELFISENNASPGLLFGEIVPGEWLVTISAHAVVTETCNYKLCVYKED
jgi:hypothetical protein